MRHTRLAVGRSLNPLVVLGVLLLLHCTSVSNARQSARARERIHCADTVNSRWGWALALCHWHAKGACVRVADEVNWRAARATEKRAAILREGEDCRRWRRERKSKDLVQLSLSRCLGAVPPASSESLRVARVGARTEAEKHGIAAVVVANPLSIFSPIHTSSPARRDAL